MSPSRLLLLFMAGGSFANLEPLCAQDTWTPLALLQQYSAEMIVTMKDGTNLDNKISMDGGKIRSEINTQGMEIISIIRPDEKKIYSVMSAQKMVMVMPYDPERIKQQMPMTAAAEGKFELVGPDAVAGVPCLKYKMTNTANKVFYFWVDLARKIPIKMAADDGSFSALWKNYLGGPQDPALFEPPTDYQVMNMPSVPGMPGGPGGGGQ